MRPARTKLPLHPCSSFRLHRRPRLTPNHRFSSNQKSAQARWQHSSSTGSSSNSSGASSRAGATPKDPSPHAQFYRETLPAMIPVALLGSAVYFGLKLVQTKLAAEKRLDAAHARITQLEAEVDALLYDQSVRGERKSEVGEAGEGVRRAFRWWWFS